MFRTVPLSIIRSFSIYTQRSCMSFSFADSLRTGSGRKCSSVLMKFHVFRPVPLSIIRTFSMYTQQRYMSYRFAHSLGAGSGRNQFRPDLARKGKTPHDGQRNWPKHVEFYSKNDFEKSAHLVGFIVRMNKQTTSFT